VEFQSAVDTSRADVLSDQLSGGFVWAEQSILRLTSSISTHLSNASERRRGSSVMAGRCCSNLSWDGLTSLVSPHKRAQRAAQHAGHADRDLLWGRERGVWAKATAPPPTQGVSHMNWRVWSIELVVLMQPWRLYWCDEGIKEAQNLTILVSPETSSPSLDNRFIIN